MKKFSKLLAVLVALAVIICPMTSAIVANATGTGSYSIVAEDANNVVLTISSTDGFLVYLADVTFNESSAFQSSYSSDGYTNGLKVIDYTLKTGSKDSYNLPAVSANYSGATLSLLVSATDSATLDLYTEVKVGIRVASGSTANLAKIQAADEGDVTTDPTLLGFGSKVNATTGAVDLDNNDNATTGVAHTHNYTKTTPYEVSAPTCTALGVYRKTCETCGAVDSSATYYGSVYADHDPSVVNNTADNKKSDATCTEAAVYYYECSVCGQAVTESMQGFVSTRTVGEALGHNMTDHPAVTPTCTTGGNTQYYSCDRCNKYFSDAAGNTEIAANSWNLSATGHTPVTIPAVAATCTTAGSTAGTKCSVCNEILTAPAPIAALGHNMTPHAAVAETCTTAGNSAYYSCDRCNKFFSDAEGNTEIAENSWVIAATGHNMTPHAAVAATCTTAGNSAYYSCDRCNKFFSDAEGNTEIAENSWVIGALGHNMTPHAANAATCTAAGNSAYWSCDRCNKFFSDAEGETEIAENSWVIPATGHTEETIPAVAATCTTAGATAGVKCSVCDTILTVPEVIPALGHDYQYEHISPSSPAQHIVTCSRCDYETTELCDTAGDEGACSKCGYLDAEIVAVEDDTLVFMTPSPSYMSTGIQINFRVRNTVLSKYADMEVVVIPDKYDMTTLNRVANPSEIVTRKSALASAGSAAKQYTYTDITLYELGLNVNYMLRAYDASGNFVAYSPVYSTSVEAYLRQQISSTSDANAKRMYIDTLVVCDEVMKNVAANHAGSDLATDYATHRVVDDIDLTQGSTSIGECNTVDDLTSYSVQFTKESTAVHQVRTSVTVEKVPYITLRIKDQSQGLDLSKLAITVTYTSVDKAGSHPYSRTFTGSDFTRVGSNRFIEMKFAEVGLHDSNKTITFACSYDGVDMFELDYSLETYESANISNATTGDMLSALIKLGQSFRTYQGLD